MKNLTKMDVLVYGTLRPGQGNYEYLIAPHYHTLETVTVEGYEMYSNGGFPYVVPSADPHSKVTADLVAYHGQDWEEFLADLDSLEGYRGEGKNNHYDREIVSYTTKDGVSGKAYIYIASKTLGRDIRKELRKIESGDWLQR